MNRQLITLSKDLGLADSTGSLRSSNNNISPENDDSDDEKKESRVDLIAENDRRSLQSSFFKCVMLLSFSSQKVLSQVHPTRALLRWWLVADHLSLFEILSAICCVYIVWWNGREKKRVSHVSHYWRFLFRCCGGLSLLFVITCCAPETVRITLDQLVEKCDNNNGET